MPRSPLEIMIDKACGYDPDTAPKREMVTLRCPACKKSMQVDRDETDPKRATVVEIICPDCDDGDRHAPIYVAADGSEVPFHEDEKEGPQNADE